MKHLLFFIMAAAVAAAQTVPINVQKSASTNEITGNLTVPASRTLTINSAVTFGDGVRQTFNPDSTNAGINVGSLSGDPATPSNGDSWYNSSTHTFNFRINGVTAFLTGTPAPIDATYITQTPSSTLTAEQPLSALSTGILQVTTSTGVLSSVTTSSGLAGLISDKTGSGALVFGTSPTIATPSITGAAAWEDGVRQTFNPNGTTPGFNPGSIAGDPSTPSNGDLWYDSTGNLLRARINGSTVSLGAGGGGGSVATDAIWTAKGQLAAATGSGAAVAVNVGTNGYVLTADSAETAGVKWAVLPSGGTLTLARFNAASNQPPGSAYATFNTRNAIAVLEFDASTDENAVFLSTMPEAALFTTGITAIIRWTAATATSGDCVWTVAFERMNTDIDSDSFATGVSGTTTTNGTSGVPNSTSINFSSSEIDGVTAGDPFRIKVTRDADAGGDTMTGDAQILAIELRQR